MLIRAVALMVLVPLLAAAAQDAGWMEFKGKEGGFTVLMPGKPREIQQAVRTPTGTIDVTLYAVERRGGEASYAVGFAEFPEQSVATGTVGRRLDIARDGAVAQAKGTLISEKRISIDKYPGRELRIDVESKSNVLTRFYAVKNKLYQLVVAGTREQVDSKDTEKFFDSFKLPEDKK
jgi:hypothetical protein